MQTIPAANNLVIQIDDGVWRLSNGQRLNEQHNEPTPLVEATTNGLTYQRTFARARNLPGGMLPAEAVEMVIVGWEDAHWHLGLLLAADYARERGGRWCGLARWPDADATLQAEAATTSGKSLAVVLDKPFRFVPAEVPVLTPANAIEVTAPAAAPLPTAYETPLPEVTAPGSPVPEVPPLETPLPAVLPNVQEMKPPIPISEWALVENRLGLNWERSRAWRLEALGRALFFGALALLFGLLSFGELRSNFAPVQPDWLPIIGVVVAVIMAVNALYHLSSLLMTSGVQFDFRSRMIRFMRRPMGIVKQVPFEKVEYVLVSHATTRREAISGGLAGESAIERIFPEVWIHVVRDKGDFLEIGHVGQTEGRAIRSRPHEPRHPLRLDEIDTPAHQAALLLARTMEVPAMVEDRG